MQDWSGGTRIGASLKAYNDEWGRRALTRGAVVVILSDGCERGDAELAGREMERLARQAFAVVWVNPLKGHAEYEPLAGGMRAALPYVDRFLSGHDVASLESLGRSSAASNGGTRHDARRQPHPPHGRLHAQARRRVARGGGLPRRGRGLPRSRASRRSRSSARRARRTATASASRWSSPAPTAYAAYNEHPDHVRFVQERWLAEIADFLEIDYEVPYSAC